MSDSIMSMSINTLEAIGNIDLPNGGKIKDAPEFRKIIEGVKVVEKKNAPAPIKSGDKKKEPTNTSSISTPCQTKIIEKTTIDNKSVIKKYLDYTDLATKKFIDSFSKKDMAFLAIKISKIYKLMPRKFYNIFEGGKIDSSKTATINEFTIKGVKWYMHCTFDKKTNNYDCDIIKEDK